MDWKEMWDNTVAMLTPDWFLVRATAYIVFIKDHIKEGNNGTPR